jgi:hypothetical protein
VICSQVVKWRRKSLAVGTLVKTVLLIMLALLLLLVGAPGFVWLLLLLGLAGYIMRGKRKSVDQPTEEPNKKDHPLDHYWG